MSQQQQKQLNSLAWWKAALAGNAPAFDPNVPARGWYRARRKGEEYKPCALWYDDAGALQCLWGNQEIAEDQARKMWLWVHKNPISYETYEAVSAGKPWPDVDPTVAAATHSMIGHNNPPADDPVADFTQKIEIAASGADKYAEIVSDEQAVQAQTLRAHLLKLHGDADKLREAEKKPFFDEAKAVDTKWQTIVKKAKTAADKIRAAIAAFETKKLQAKAAKPPAPDDVAEKPAPIAPIKGASGRAASVKTRRVATAITNLEALLHSIKSRPEFEPLILTLAQKILDENGDCLGVAISTVAEVR